MSLGIVGIALASIVTFLLPTSRWSLIPELLAYLAVGAVVVAVLLPFVQLVKDAESS